MGNDKSSRESCKKFVQEKFGKIDVLINNAGFAYKRDSKVSDLKQAEDTLQTNYFDTAEFTKLMSDVVDERVVFISSLCSDTSFMSCCDDIKDFIKSRKFTCDDVD